MRLGIISDTHGMLRPEVIEILKGCDAILHAGDIDSRHIVNQLERIAPLYIVRGNMDGEWSRDIPKTLIVNLNGRKFYIIHNVDRVDEDVIGADFVIFGHTHEYKELKSNNMHFLNPGSCGRERYGLPPTMAVIELKENGEYEIIKIDLNKGIPDFLLKDSGLHNSNIGNINDTTDTNIASDSNITGTNTSFASTSVSHAAAATATTINSATTSPNNKNIISENELFQIVRTVVREIDRGKSVERISEKHKIPFELVDKICRMYLTHPGIDTDGIINRL